MKPIAITGYSVFAPGGADASAFWETLIDGVDRRSSWPRRKLDQYPVNNVIAIPEKAWDRLADRPGATRSDRMAAFLTREALASAEMKIQGVAPVGFVLGTTTAAAELAERSVLNDDRANDAPACPDAGLIAGNDVAWGGPTLTLSTACSSGLLAAVLATEILAAGEAEAMLAGGMDVLLEYTICGFNTLRVATRETCRPFGNERKGVVLSEGGACFCLEPLDEARARQSKVHAHIIGYGISCDGGHPTAPGADGISRAIQQAFQSADVAPSDIAGIIAHGTGTPTNDLVEIEALRKAFGETGLPPVTSVKGAIGHAQGGAGAMALLAAMLSLEKGYLPGVANLDEVDPALGQVTVSNEPTPLGGECLMVNAFGFGGNNCVLIVAGKSFLAGRRP